MPHVNHTVKIHQITKKVNKILTQKQLQKQKQLRGGSSPTPPYIKATTKAKD